MTYRRAARDAHRAGARSEAHRTLEAAIEAMQSRSWPGNVRELQNVVRHGVARALAGRVTTISVDHLGFGNSGPSAPVGSLTEATEAFQRERAPPGRPACEWRARPTSADPGGPAGAISHSS